MSGVEKEQSTVDNITPESKQTPEQLESLKELQAWKQEKHKHTPLKEFSVPHELIEVLLSTNQYNGLVFHGEGGIGKTVLTLDTIKSNLESDEWEYSNGYTTPLSLYEFLYTNRNKKAIILDDLSGLFTNPLSLSILKGALWDTDGKRIVQYASNSEKATVPQMFVMEAKVLILCNNIPKARETSMRAVLSRTIAYDVKFSFSQKMSICTRFIKDDKSLTPAQSTQILDILAKNVTEATQDFNFRTIRKCMAFVQYDPKKAEELFKATTTTDELKAAYILVSKLDECVRFQAMKFAEITGKSKRTYFTVKKQMKNAEMK